MTQCLNPDCLQVNQAQTRFCISCGEKLVLRERYRPLKIIGQGGFGRTFQAVDEDKPSKPFCVIKQFFPQAQGTKILEKAAKLFAQEAERLDGLGRHSQIPELLAYFTQDNRQYLVQEFIDGQNLKQELEESVAFSENQILELLKSLLPVLEFIHSQQIIHRDIKPENIIRRIKDNQLVLVDFGAAKYATMTALGRMGTVIGSAGYVAPEQSVGRASFVSDIYSLGVTCIHLLTKIEPFDLFDVSENDWVWRNYLQSNVSNQCGEILDKMIVGATKKRFQNVGEILSVIQLTSQRKTQSISPTHIFCPSCLHENPLDNKYCGLCGTALTSTPTTFPSSVSGLHLPMGTLLKQGCYKIGKVLGQGGFGIIYKAIYCPNSALVAIKELWPASGYRQGKSVIWPASTTLEERKEQVEKFKLEASYLQRCKSPNISKIYDCFEENSSIYMVMEYIDGVSLSSLVVNKNCLQENKVIEYAKQIAN
ncbi:MAG: protein kinase, partial [Trichodesmium sp. St2_bin2_1]|nr:protein kinase [Trichodesmium sp. St2_bin2_1]